jgi:hypothetical protein
MGRTKAQGEVGDATAGCGVACGQYLWQYPESLRIDQPAEKEKTHYTVLRAVLAGHGTESALVHGFQRAMLARRMR